MNVDAILLSEFATLTDGAMLTVVKVYNQVNTRALPAVVPFMAISTVIHAHHSESGTEHEAETILVNAQRKELAKFKQKFTLNPKGGTHIPGIPIRHVLIAQVHQAEFNEAGPYAFEVYIDGTYMAATAFAVTVVSDDNG